LLELETRANSRVHARCERALLPFAACRLARPLRSLGEIMAWYTATVRALGTSGALLIVAHCGSSSASAPVDDGGANDGTIGRCEEHCTDSGSSGAPDDAGPRDGTTS